MKKLSLLFILFTLIFSCNSEKSSDELIFIVQMSVINEKSNQEIKDFSKYYTAAIQQYEPNSLGWGFYNSYGGIYNSADRIILIERYLDENAMMEHGKNISEGGKLESHFKMFSEHFEIKKIDVYGNPSERLKEFVRPFGLPFYFHPPLAKFSRN